MDGKTLEYLDRQHVACGGDEAFVSVAVTRSGCSGNQMRYRFGCTEVPAQSSRQEMSSCSPMDGNDLQYLDRQNVACGTGEAMTSFVVTREGCGGNDMRYKYECASLVGMTSAFALATSSNEQTGCNTMDSEKLQYLDRQNLQCPDGKLMTSFRVVRTGCGGQDMRYAFSCAAVPPPPTPAPTPVPTPAPTPAPTPEEQIAEIYGDPHLVGYHENHQTAALLQQSTSVSEEFTVCTPMDGESLQYLDRQHVVCGGDA